MGIVKRDPFTGRAVRTHGMESTATYCSWKSMIERCTNPKNRSYIKWYGNQGITVCARWRTFENFLADMGERPPGATLDRYPNNAGNYEPGNCRWASWKEQQRNRKSNRRLKFNGELLTCAEIAERLGISTDAFLQRLRRGLRPPILFDRQMPTKAQKVSYNGEMLTIRELSARTGIKTATLYYRLKHGLKSPSLYQP